MEKKPTPSHAPHAAQPDPAWIAEPASKRWLCGSVVPWGAARRAGILLACPMDEERDEVEERAAKIVGGAIGFLAALPLGLMAGVGGALALGVFGATIWTLLRSRAQEEAFAACSDAAEAWEAALKERGADPAGLTQGLDWPMGKGEPSLEFIVAMDPLVSALDGGRSVGNPGAFSTLCIAAASAALLASPGVRAAWRGQREASKALEARGLEWSARLLPQWSARGESAEIGAALDLEPGPELPRAAPKPRL